MFVEFMYHLLQFDLVWLMSLVLSSIHWIFIFLVIMHIFTRGQATVLGAGLLILNIWLVLDVVKVLGWVILVAEFFVVYYFGKMALLTFVSDTPDLEKRLVLVNEAIGFGSLIIVNLWFLGFI